LTDINAAQCRGARAMLQLGVRELARLAKLSPTTITMFERGRSTPTPETLKALRRVFEKKGIVFVIDTEAPGVLLKKKK